MYFQIRCGQFAYCFLFYVIYSFFSSAQNIVNEYKENGWIVEYGICSWKYGKTIHPWNTEMAIIRRRFFVCGFKKTWKMWLFWWLEFRPWLFVSFPLVFIFSWTNFTWIRYWGNFLEHWLSMGLRRTKKVGVQKSFSQEQWLSRV